MDTIGFKLVDNHKQSSKSVLIHSFDGHVLVEKDNFKHLTRLM